MHGNFGGINPFVTPWVRPWLGLGIRISVSVRIDLGLGFPCWLTDMGRMPVPQPTGRMI